MPNEARAEGSRSWLAAQAPLRERSQGRAAPVVASSPLVQDWSAVVLPRLMASCTLPVAVGEGADSVSSPLPPLRETADAPVLLRYRLVAGPSGAWRIADITYPGEPGFRLSSFLSELLDTQRNGEVKR